MTPGRAAVLAVALAAVLAACGGDDAAGGDDTASGSTEVTRSDQSGSDDQSGAGTVLKRRDAAGAGSELTRGGSDVASEVERRVAETLSELDARMRDGDTVVTLPSRVLFDFDEHELRADAGEVLDGLAEAAAHFADAPVAVHGHTDSVGGAAYNQRLSERRAESVVGYLVDAGVAADRITARGLGENEPVAPNTGDDGSDNPEGRARNRRVEVILEGVDLDELGR